MRTAIKYTIRFGIFVLAIFSLVEITGHIMLSRKVKSAGSLIPIDYFRATESERRWKIINDTMQTGPHGGYTLTAVDIERAKELVYVALTCAPEEWEGGDSVAASSATVLFLAEFYPSVKQQINQFDRHISLSQLRDILYQHPPQGWQVVWAGLFGKW